MMFMGEAALLKLLKDLKDTDAISDSASDSSFSVVSHPSVSTDKPTAPLVKEIPALLDWIKQHVEKGFQDTRVLEVQPSFVEDVTKVPFQLILNHGCLVLGPAGAGKTTLVNHLGGVQFETGPPRVSPNFTCSKL